MEEKIPTLKLLLKHGADPNRPYLGIPLIVLAARVGNVEAFRLLIEAGAKLFDDPRIAPNALFEAVGRGHKEIVQFLIERGVNFTSRKRFGKSALEFAEEKGMTEILDLLRRYKRTKKCA